MRVICFGNGNQAKKRFSDNFRGDKQTFLFSVLFHAERNELSRC